MPGLMYAALMLLLVIQGAWCSGSTPTHSPSNGILNFEQETAWSPSSDFKPARKLSECFTCKDKWIPAGTEFNVKVKPYLPMVIFYAFGVLTAVLKLTGTITTTLIRRHDPAAVLPKRLPMAIVSCLVTLVSLISWVAAAPWTIDGSHARFNINNQWASVPYAQSAVLAVRYLVELADNVHGCTWLYWLHHALFWVTASRILVNVVNPYELFLAWLYVGNTNMHVVTLASHVFYHMSKAWTSIQWFSTRFTSFSLYFSVAHQIIAQAAMITYLIVYWNNFSPLIKYGFIIFNPFWVWETMIHINGSCCVLEKANALDGFGKVIMKMTLPAKRLVGRSDARNSQKTAAVEKALPLSTVTMQADLYNDQPVDLVTTVVLDPKLSM